MTCPSPVSAPSSLTRAHYSQNAMSFFASIGLPRRSTPLPYTTLFRSPFTKYDQLFVPEFNAGAMENAGAVTLLENYVFRRSEEHTSELQSRGHLVCRLLPETQKIITDELTIPCQLDFMPDGRLLITDQ